MEAKECKRGKEGKHGKDAAYAFRLHSLPRLVLGVSFLLFKSSRDWILLFLL